MSSQNNGVRINMHFHENVTFFCVAGAEGGSTPAAHWNPNPCNCTRTPQGQQHGQGQGHTVGIPQTAPASTPTPTPTPYEICYGFIEERTGSPVQYPTPKQGPSSTT